VGCADGQMGDCGWVEKDGFRPLCMEQLSQFYEDNDELVCCSMKGARNWWVMFHDGCTEFMVEVP
ncbi:hypothetical protein Ancab_028347, partial [Ancistrocladus abbreviatus]